MSCVHRASRHTVTPACVLGRRGGRVGGRACARASRATTPIARCVPPARDCVERPSSPLVEQPLSSPGALCPCGVIGGTAPGGVSLACRCQLANTCAKVTAWYARVEPGRTEGRGLAPARWLPPTDRLPMYAAPVGPGAGLRDAPTAALRSWRRKGVQGWAVSALAAPARCSWLSRLAILSSA